MAPLAELRAEVCKADVLVRSAELLVLQEFAFPLAFAALCAANAEARVQPERADEPLSSLKASSCVRPELATLLEELAVLCLF